MHRIVIICLLLMTALSSRASHIVGGEITYTCDGPGLFTINISIYRDCLGGYPDALKEDGIARITIFNSAGRLIDTMYIEAENLAGELVPTNFQSNCVANAPRVCLNKIVFKRTLRLDNTATGYKIVYQRCCRNASVVNLIDPGSVGAHYSCIIPPAYEVPCNNSAVFKNYPPQIICINNPLVYDHGATDRDGDSLSYELCEGRGFIGNASNIEPVTFTGEVLPYAPSYSATRPMICNPALVIDPKTGKMMGTPTLNGRFVVTVCCHEWRDGKIINTVTREFQFVVTSCSRLVIADIPQYSEEFNTYIVNCKDYTVHFDNLSTKGLNYRWDFGVESLSSDTSSEFEPTYTYPDSGVYLVNLKVFSSSTCKDSISRFVKVYPRLDARISAPDKACVGDTIQFLDLSSSSYEIDAWRWSFDDFTEPAKEKNPQHVYTKGGLFNVGLAVSNSKLCRDTAFVKVFVDPFAPNVGNDTAIVQGETILFPDFAGSDYIWTPSTYLSNPFIPNPVGTFIDTGVFVYTVSAKSPVTGCPGSGKVTVKVYSGPSLALPNAFTPNGDGKNDKFRPLIIGYREIVYFRVFNRYGQQVFESKSMDAAWDGTFQGKEQEMGVYYWVMTVKDRKGKEEIIKGDVTLIR